MYSKIEGGAEIPGHPPRKPHLARGHALMGQTTTFLTNDSSTKELVASLFFHMNTHTENEQRWPGTFRIRLADCLMAITKVKVLNPTG